MDRFTLSDRGYNIQEVNAFVENVINQTEDMLDKMKKQQKEIEMLKGSIEKSKQTETELKNALTKLEQSNDLLRKEAYEEKNNIMADARANASRIINDALLRAEKIELRADTLERHMRIFKRKLKLVVEQQLAVIDEIEELELK